MGLIKFPMQRLYPDSRSLVVLTCSMAPSMNEKALVENEWISYMNLADSGRFLQDDASTARNLSSTDSYKITSFCQIPAR